MKSIDLVSYSLPNENKGRRLDTVGVTIIITVDPFFGSRVLLFCIECDGYSLLLVVADVEHEAEYVWPC